MNKDDYSFERVIQIITHPAFAMLWLGLAIFSYFNWDRSIAWYMHEHQSAWLMQSAQIITRLGLGGSYLLISALVFLMSRFFWPRPKIAAGSLLIFLSVAISGLLCLIVKIGLARARPTGLFTNDLYGFYFLQFKAPMWSFPSGHALTIASVAVAASILWPRYWLGFFSLMALVAASRILITAHYLSDVMTGLYLGAVITILVAKKLQKISWLEFPRQDTVLLGPSKNLRNK